MKYLFVCLLAVAVFQTRPSDAFISSLINGLNNIVGSVVDSVNNGVNSVINTVSSGIDSVTSTINTVTQVGQFLWDNAVNPSLTVLQQSIYVSLKVTTEFFIVIFAFKNIDLLTLQKLFDFL